MNLREGMMPDRYDLIVLGLGVDELAGTSSAEPEWAVVAPAGEGGFGGLG